jgi:hypothetical protein
MNNDSADWLGRLVLNENAYASFSRHSANILLYKIAFGFLNPYSNPFHDSILLLAFLLKTLVSKKIWRLVENKDRFSCKFHLRSSHFSKSQVEKNFGLPQWLHNLPFAHYPISFRYWVSFGSSFIIVTDQIQM